MRNHISVMLAAFVGVVFYFFPVPFPAGDNLKDMFSASIGFGAIVAGFIATAISILMSLPSDSVMGRIKATTYLNDLICLLKHCFLSALGFSLYNLIAFFFLGAFSFYLQVAWIFFAVYTFYTLFEVSSLMLKILKKP